MIFHCVTLAILYFKPGIYHILKLLFWFLLVGISAVQVVGLTYCGAILWLFSVIVLCMKFQEIYDKIKYTIEKTNSKVASFKLGMIIQEIIITQK